MAERTCPPIMILVQPCDSIENMIDRLLIMSMEMKTGVLVYNGCKRGETFLPVARGKIFRTADDLKSAIKMLGQMLEYDGDFNNAYYTNTSHHIHLGSVAG